MERGGVREPSSADNDLHWKMNESFGTFISVHIYRNWSSSWVSENVAKHPVEEVRYIEASPGRCLDNFFFPRIFPNERFNMDPATFIDSRIDILKRLKRGEKFPPPERKFSKLRPPSNVIFFSFANLIIDEARKSLWSGHSISFIMRSYWSCQRRHAENLFLQTN